MKLQEDQIEDRTNSCMRLPLIIVVAPSKFLEECFLFIVFYR